MTNIYFFENINGCSIFKKQLLNDFPKYLQNSEDNNSQFRHYLILDWITSNKMGANVNWLKKNNIRFVNTVKDLPTNSGVFISSYGGNYQEIKELKEKNTPIIERICPWVKLLIREIESVAENEQCVIMIDEDHMVIKNYGSILPKDTIIINEVNYEEKLIFLKPDKPVHFMVYNTFRPVEAGRVVEFINTNYYNPNNKYQIKTTCGWVLKSGLFEEIKEKIKELNLKEIWVICSGVKDRSTRSVINEINENNAKYQIIQKIEDIPTEKLNDRNIGILKTPIPFEKGKEIINKIKILYSK